MSALRKAIPGLKELRIFGCQSSQASAGVRAFIKQSYPAVKKANPDLPILIRESIGTPARAFARFDRGVERAVMLDGAAGAEEVEKRIESILK
ncbi:NADH dehydrogenase, alpha subcomplex, subunit 2 [Meredithblackwellia eburnea MCA 4105]